MLDRRSANMTARGWRVDLHLVIHHVSPSLTSQVNKSPGKDIECASLGGRWRRAFTERQHRAFEDSTALLANRTRLISVS